MNAVLTINLWYVVIWYHVLFIDDILGNTFDLKLVSTGEDGIEEMIEDLNANKILYAFIKGSKILFIHFFKQSFRFKTLILHLLNHKFT